MTHSHAAIPIEELGVVPPPGMEIPNTFRFSRDDRLLFYLHNRDGGGQLLYALDTASGQTRVLVAPPGGGVTSRR